MRGGCPHNAGCRGDQHNRATQRHHEQKTHITQNPGYYSFHLSWILFSNVSSSLPSPFSPFFLSLLSFPFLFLPLPSLLSSNMSNVRVVCRTRPLNRAEIERGGYNILEYSSDFSSMQIQNPGDERMKHTFNFDRCFPPGTHQADVYNFVAKPILDDVFHGYNGTLFVYGQTGSGLFLRSFPKFDIALSNCF